MKRAAILSCVFIILVLPLYCLADNSTPLTGTLVVITEPQGAEVWIQGEQQETKTPAKFILKSGNTHVTVNFKGARV